MSSEKTPHPHAALIKAWADGATIQFYDEEYNKWFDCAHGTPSWHKTTLYRIKPEEPKQSIPEGLSDGEKALIEALRLTPSFEPSWGNFKVLDCEDETLIGLATVAVDTGNWVASPHRIFQALKQIAGEKRKGGEQ